MQLLENIFLGMFLVGFLFTVVSAILSGALSHTFGEGTAFDAHGAHPGSMGGDVHHVPGAGHAEVGWAQHELPGFSPLSPTTLSAFVTAAGGMGWAAMRWWEWGPWAASALALVCGLAFAALVFFGMSLMFRVTQGSSMVALDSLVGMEAEVSLVIPPGALGEVVFVRNGQRATMAARCADGAAVARGATVVIKSVSPTQFIVEETRESWLARTKGRDAQAAR